MSGESGRPVVLHVSQAVSAGVAHVVADLVVEQVAEGWQVVVACPRGDLSDLASAAGADVLTWQAARGPGPGLAGELRRLRRIVQDVAPDVVHLHSSQAALVGRAVVRGRIPTVFTPHAWSWLSMSARGRRAVIGWERFATRWTTAIGCVSEDERRDGVRAGLELPAERWRVIPNTVQVSDTETRAEARELLGITTDDELVVCVGRLAPQKGQLDLLTAWSPVLAARPKARLVLVGTGPLHDEIAERADGLGRVTLTGWQPRPDGWRWMRAADLVVTPSHYEGMSLVPLEAAALGVPVVATAVEGMASELSARARTLVPVSDPAALAEAIVSALADPAGRQVAGDEARAWSQRQSASLVPGRAYAELYRSLIG